MTEAIHFLEGKYSSYIGLFFSLLTQFNGYVYKTDSEGNVTSYKITDESCLGKDIPQKIYLGIVSWIFETISKNAESNAETDNEKYGKGIKLPKWIKLFVDEMSVVPELDKMVEGEGTTFNFAEKCTELINEALLGKQEENSTSEEGDEQGFDLNVIRGVAHEAIIGKQYLPIVMNEMIVRGFYTVRAFMKQIEEKNITNIEDLDKVDIRAVLPIADKRLTRMITLSSVMFSVVDISGAAVKAVVKSGNKKDGFVTEFIQGINYLGLGRLMLAVSADMEMGVQELSEKLVSMVKTGKEQITARVAELTKLGSPAGFVTAAIGVYQEIKDALTELDIAKETRVKVEQSCEESIALMSEYYEQMNTLVEEYLVSHMEAFASGFEKMDKAIAANDINGFIAGNNVIQDFLGYKPQFRNQDEFDELMLSEESLKF